MSMSQPKNSKMISEHMFRSFSKISDFVAQLYEVFGGKFHELTLYNHLLTKTKLSHKQAIKRHIEIFSEFCSRNKDAIAERDHTKIVSGVISYSEKVSINLPAIFACHDMDTDTETQIWSHILVINATIDPSSDARTILQQLQTESTSEGKFLDGFMNKIEQSVDRDKLNADPVSAASSILQSGVLNDLVGSIDSGVKSGNLDLSKLVGTVQQMLSGLSQSGDGGGGIDIGNIMSMMGSLGGMGGGIGGMGGGMPGLSDGLSADKVHDSIDKKVEAELQKEKQRVTDEAKNGVIDLSP